MRLYHFTNLYHLPEILKTGVIRTTESNGDIIRGREHAKPDVVWLLDTPVIEFNHGLSMLPHFTEQMTEKQLLIFDKTNVRIVIDIPDYRVERWYDWAKRHNVDAATMASLVFTGGGDEAAKHWYVSEHPISRKWWVAVDITNEIELE